MKLTKQGVRDLNHLEPKVHVDSVVREKARDTKDELDAPMQHDLIYDPAAEEDIRNTFPDAKIEKVWDCIHDTRLQVKIDCSLRRWFTFLIVEGWAGVSIIFQLQLISNTMIISNLMDDIRPGWRKKK